RRCQPLVFGQTYGIANMEMAMIARPWRFYMLSLLFAICAIRASLAEEPASGWRGNRTGLWLNASTPVEWSRIPHGAMEGIRCGAERPASAEGGDAASVEKGLLRDWLVIGPFAVADSVQDFDKDFLGGEATVEASVGDKAADRVWQLATVPPDDPMVFGTA